jgi:hypothetical protein
MHVLRRGGDLLTVIVAVANIDDVGCGEPGPIAIIVSVVVPSALIPIVIAAVVAASGVCIAIVIAIAASRIAGPISVSISGPVVEISIVVAILAGALQ